jgi:hypothetical protein
LPTPYLLTDNDPDPIAMFDSPNPGVRDPNGLKALVAPIERLVGKGLFPRPINKLLIVPFEPLVEIDPVTPNEPVIWADPVKGNEATLGAQEADVAKEALVANEALVTVPDPLKDPVMPSVTISEPVIFEFPCEKNPFFIKNSFAMPFPCPRYVYYKYDGLYQINHCFKCPS